MEGLIKKLFCSKTLKTITNIFAILFVMYFFAFAVFQYISTNNLDNTYSTLIASVDDFNTMVSNENSTKSETEIPIETAIFSNSKEAGVYAFNQLYNFTSYEIFATGNFFMSALGYDVTGKLNIRAIQYDDKEQYMETVKYQSSGTSLGLTKGTKTLFANDGTRYDLITKSVTATSNSLSANYASSSWKVNEEPKSTQIGLYLVNASTIVSSTELEIVYNAITKKISQYQFSLTINPKISTKDYAKMVYEQGGKTLPNFSNIILNCVLDNNGNLISFISNEEYTTQANLSLYEFTANVKNTITYNLLSYNSTVSVQKPIINID